MPTDNYDAVHKYEDKWWFWNESSDHREGPFEDEEDAKVGLTCYVNYLNGDCATCACKFDPDNYYEINDGKHKVVPVCASCAEGVRIHAATVQHLTGVRLNSQLVRKVK